MIRVTIPLSDSSRDILAMYKKIRKIKNTNDVVEAFVQEHGKDLEAAGTLLQKIPNCQLPLF